MKNRNQLLYIIAGIAALILLVIVVIVAAKGAKDSSNTSVSNTPQEPAVYKEPEIAQIEPSDLPSKKELKDLRLVDVIQTDKINDQFALAKYEIDGATIIYYFQANKVTNGERLTVTARYMNPAEYEIYLPSGEKVQKTNIGEFEMTFYDRMIYYVEDENSQIPPTIQKNAENGNAEIRYRKGKSELVKCQSMQWYDNGIAYNMESLNRSYSLEDMSRLVADYLNNRK